MKNKQRGQESQKKLHWTLEAWPGEVEKKSWGGDIIKNGVLKKGVKYLLVGKKKKKEGGYGARALEGIS